MRSTSPMVEDNMIDKRSSTAGVSSVKIRFVGSRPRPGP